MTIKRLEELKELMQIQIHKARPEDLLDENDAEDLQALIDDAIARLDSTDSTRVSEDVEAAIKLLEKGWIVTGPEGYLRYPDGFDEAIKTVIAALRSRMRTDPCYWCDPARVLFSASTLDATHSMDTDEPNHCSYCGRALRQIKGEPT